MLSFFLFVATFLGWNWFFALRVPLNMAPLVTTSALTLLLYFAAWHGVLPLVSNGLLWAGLLCFLACVWREWQTPEKKSPVWLFAAIWFLLLLANQAYTQGRFLSQWDEFTFWGPISRYLFEHQAWPDQETILLFKDYPPGVALWAQFVYAAFGHYSESLLYFAQNTLLLSGLFVAFDLKKITASFLQLISASAILFLFEKSVFHSAYVDCLLGVHLFAIFYLMVTWQERFKGSQHLWMLWPALIVLPLIKQVGYFFALWAGVSGLVGQKGWRPRVIFFIGLLLIGWVHQTWVWHVAELGVSASFQAKKIDWALAGPVTLDFMRAFFLQPFNHRLFISPGLLTLGLLFVQHRFLKNAEASIRCRPILLWVLAGLWVHVLGILGLYLTAYSREEATHLASFMRYLSQYFVGYTLLIFFLSAKVWRGSVWHNRKIGLGVGLLISLALLLGPRMGLRTDHGAAAQYNRREIAERARQIQAQIGSKNRVKQGSHRPIQIYLVDKRNWDGFARYLYAYELPDVAFNGFSNVYLIPKTPPHAPAWFAGIPLPAWEKTLQSYDAVFLEKTDQDFRRDYGVLFDSPVADGVLYQVVRDSGRIRLKKWFGNEKRKE